jgi:prepilin-type N-terminal cleavage/methylation domain-containing protein
MHIKPGQRIDSRSGFTLVETTLAMLVLGVALGACILSFSMAMRTVSTAGNQMAAMHALRNQVEILRTNRIYTASLKVGTYGWTNRTYTGSGTLTFIGTYTVTSLNTNTKSLSVSLPYRNFVRRGYTTNTLSTLMVSTLHP